LFLPRHWGIPPFQGARRLRRAANLSIAVPRFSVSVRSSVRALALVQRHAAGRQEGRGDADCDQGEADRSKNAFGAHRSYFPSSRFPLRTWFHRVVQGTCRSRQLSTQGTSHKAGAPHPKLDRHHEAAAHHCADPAPLSMSVLLPAHQTDKLTRFVTQ